MLRTKALWALFGIGLAALGCGDGEEQTGSGGGDVMPTSRAGTGGDGGAMGMGCDASTPPSRFISCVKLFQPGENAGFGQEGYPAIVYGPPRGAGSASGSLDVLSLGSKGEIVVGFGANAIVDDDGIDFIVFENSFFQGGDPESPNADLAEISVSEDGENFTAFPCKKEGPPYEGCAGWHPVFTTPENGFSPFDPQAAGGDLFDLKTIGVKKARFIRIRDLGNPGGPGTAGFDLDAAAIVHAEKP